MNTPPIPPRSIALDKMRGDGMNPEMKNPLSGPEGAKGASFFIDKAMLPEGCKTGEEVYVKGTVGKIGTKVEITPSDVVSATEEEANENELENSEAQDVEGGSMEGGEKE